jgi:hypothetical protein
MPASQPACRPRADPRRGNGGGCSSNANGRSAQVQGRRRGCAAAEKLKYSNIFSGLPIDVAAELSPPAHAADRTAFVVSRRV